MFQFGCCCFMVVAIAVVDSLSSLLFCIQLLLIL